MACSAPTSGDMIVHEITRYCSGVRVNFDVVVMPGMLWLYIGDGDNRFDALSFAAGMSGQKIPASSCLMKGAEEDRGMPTMTHLASLVFPAFLRHCFQAKLLPSAFACERLSECSVAVTSTVPCLYRPTPSCSLTTLAQQMSLFCLSLLKLKFLRF
jgi:hypothetical protein